MKILKFIRERVLQVFSILIIVYLMLPLAVIILLSFNKPKGRQNTSWNEFSLDAWTNICRDQTICTSFATSIRIGFLVTIISTIIGTMISFALIRHRYRGRGATSLLVFLPLPHQK
jgi:spermidine/putrescine transport system permease protein